MTVREGFAHPVTTGLYCRHGSPDEAVDTRFGSTATGVFGVLCLTLILYPELISYLSSGNGPPPQL